MKNIPGAIWVSLLLGLAKLISEVFPEAEFVWVAGVVLLLTTAANLLKVYWPKGEPETVEAPTPAQLGVPVTAADMFPPESGKVKARVTGGDALRAVLFGA